MDFLLPGQQEGILWEANIIAYPQSECDKLRLKSRKLDRPWAHVIALEERDAVGDVDIEKVLLPVRCSDSTLLVEAETSVENAAIALDELREAPTDDVSVGVFRKG